MTTNLETLLNSDLFQELINAINNNLDFSYSGKGFDINAKTTDNSLLLIVSYEDKEEQTGIEKEVLEFQNFVESLDDDLFVEICEAIGEEDLNKIQMCLGSGNIDSVRAGIFKFKQVLNVVVNVKIEELKTLLNY